MLKSKEFSWMVNKEVAPFSSNDLDATACGMAHTIQESIEIKQNDL